MNAWNLGELCRKEGNPHFVPCTTKAILELLKLAMFYDNKLEGLIIDSNDEKNLKDWLAGKKVTVLGRSDIVGMPTFLALLKLDATVAMCHSQSNDTKERLAEADIIIVAIGKANWVIPSLIKNDAIVIDVGINSIPTKNQASFVGDVDQTDLHVLQNLKYVTPVPGGVGPMTVVMLLDNILISAERSTNKIMNN